MYLSVNMRSLCERLHKIIFNFVAKRILCLVAWCIRPGSLGLSVLLSRYGFISFIINQTLFNQAANIYTRTCSYTNTGTGPIFDMFQSYRRKIEEKKMYAKTLNFLFRFGYFCSIGFLLDSIIICLEQIDCHCMSK